MVHTGILLIHFVLQTHQSFGYCEKPHRHTFVLSYTFDQVTIDQPHMKLYPISP